MLDLGVVGSDAVAKLLKDISVGQPVHSILFSVVHCALLAWSPHLRPSTKLRDSFLSNKANFNFLVLICFMSLVQISTEASLRTPFA